MCSERRFQKTCIMKNAFVGELVELLPIGFIHLEGLN